MYKILGAILLICIPLILLAADSPQTPPAYVKAKQWKNVRDYGATGNGSTNDAAAIQAAVNAVADSGGVIYIPAGEYLVEDTSIMLGDNISIVGDGRASKLVAGHTHSIAMAPRTIFINADTTNGDSCIIIDGVYMEGGFTASTYPSNDSAYGVHFINVHKSAIRNCFISRIQSDGIAIRKGRDNIVSGNIIWDVGEEAITISNSPSGRTIISNNILIGQDSTFEVAGAKGGGVLVKSAGVTVDGNVFKYWGTGVDVNWEGKDTIRDIVVSNNVFENVMGAGVAFMGAYNSAIVNNTFRHCFGYGVLLYRWIVAPDTAYPHDILISGNVFQNQKPHTGLTRPGVPILCYYATDVTIANNTIKNSDSTAIWLSGREFNVYANNIDTAGGFGIRIDSGWYSIVQSNKIARCDSTGIHVQAYTVGRYMKVADNHVNNCSGHGIALVNVQFSNVTANTVIENSDAGATSGLYLYDCYYNVITSNLAMSPSGGQDYGINFSANHLANIVANNYVWGNSNTQIANSTQNMEYANRIDSLDSAIVRFKTAVKLDSMIYVDDIRPAGNRTVIRAYKPLQTTTFEIAADSSDIRFYEEGGLIYIQFGDSAFSTTKANYRPLYITAPGANNLQDLYLRADTVHIRGSLVIDSGLTATGSFTADSATKIDTTYAPFQNYVANHAGAGAGDEIKVDSAGTGSASVAMTSPVIFKQGSFIDFVIINGDTVRIDGVDSSAAIRADIRDTVNIMGITDSSVAGTGLTETGNTINLGNKGLILAGADTVALDTGHTFFTAFDPDKLAGDATDDDKVDSSIIPTVSHAVFADSADGFTTEKLQDAVGAMVTGNTETGITVTYQDADGTIDFVVTGGSGDSALVLVQTSGDSTEIVKWVGDSLMIVWIGGDTCWWYKGEIDCGEGALSVDSIFVLNGTDTARITNVFIDSIRAGQFGGSSVAAQSITKTEIDSTASNVVFDDAYRGTSASADSAYATEYFVKVQIEDSLNEYVLTSAFNLVTDDTVSWKAAADSVAAWDNGALGTANITNQSLIAADLDSTASNFIFDDAYRGTSATAESLYATERFVKIQIEDSLNEYVLTTAFNLVTDDTVSWKAATDSVAAWDNGALGTANITNQSLTMADLDTTASNFVFDDAYRGTSATADSLYATERFVKIQIEDSLNEYTLLTDFAKVTDDTIAWQAAKDSVAAWDNMGYPIGNYIDTTTLDTIHIAHNAVDVDTTQMPKLSAYITNNAVTVTEATDLFIKGDLKITGQIMQSGTMAMSDTCFPWANNADTSLTTLLNWWGTNIFVHPAVYTDPSGFGIDSGAEATGWNKGSTTPAGGLGWAANKDYHWKYWMANTPMPQDSENPCIRVSNDGTTWLRPYGFDGSDTVWVKDPLIRPADIYNCDYLSDPDVFLSKEGDIVVTIRAKQNGGTDCKILAMPSSDGVTFDMADTFSITEYAGYRISPSILLDANGDYKMWYIHKVSDSTVLQLLTRRADERFDTVWANSPVTCTLSTFNANHHIWHFDVTRFYNEYHLFFQTDSVGGTDGDGNSYMYMYKSLDGIKWTPMFTGPIMLRHPTSGAWDYTRLYRPSAVWTATPQGYVYDIFYSAYQDDATPRTGRTRLYFDKSPEIWDLLVAGYDRPPADSVTLTLRVHRGDTTGIVFIDSTNAASGDDTVFGDFTAPYDCYPDSMILVYSTNGKIDQIDILATKQASTLRIPDSVYLSDATDRTSTSPERIAIALTPWGRTGRVMLKGDRIAVKLYNVLADDNDKVIAYSWYIKGRRKF